MDQCLVPGVDRAPGIISVPIELQPVFIGLLIQFYESNGIMEIKQFLYENCIDGIEFTPSAGVGDREGVRAVNRIERKIQRKYYGQSMVLPLFTF